MDDFRGHLIAVRYRLRVEIERLTAQRAEIQAHMPALPRELLHGRNVLFLLRARLITVQEQLRFQQTKCMELQRYGEALLQHLNFVGQHQYLQILLSECQSVFELASAARKAYLNSA